MRDKFTPTVKVNKRSVTVSSETPAGRVSYNRRAPDGLKGAVLMAALIMVESYLKSRRGKQGEGEGE